jgi:putative sterol carrier protein
VIDLRARGFFDALVLATRLAGGRVGSGVDAGGFEGAVELVVTGEGGATWHAVLSRGTIHFHRGPHPAPRSTVRLPVATLVDLLTGKTSWMTASMTGKVRIQGEGHGGMMFAAMVAQFRSACERKDVRGMLARAWQRLVLT